MAPIIQQQDPLTAALGAVAGYLSQKQQNTNDAADRALNQRQVDAQISDANTRRQLTLQQIAAATVAANQAKANKQFESGLQLPKGWAKMTPDQKISYYQQRLNAAQRVGDSGAVTDTQNLINSLGLDAERLAIANYTAGPKSDLTRAQTWSIRTEKPKEFQMKLAADTAALKTKLGQQWNIAVMREQGAMERNAASIGARQFVARLNAEQRTDVATMSAYNRLAGMDEQSALKAAVDQYQSQMLIYRSGLSAAAKAGGDTLQQFQQTTPMPQLNVTVPTQAPQVIIIPNPSNPGGPGLPVVVNHPRAPIGGEIQTAIGKGYAPDDPHVIQALQKDGYSRSEISAAIATYKARNKTKTTPRSFGWGTP